jgi:hypothetical protein
VGFGKGCPVAVMIAASIATATPSLLRAAIPALEPDPQVVAASISQACLWAVSSR